jgi:hypothetical protein
LLGARHRGRNCTAVQLLQQYSAAKSGACAITPLTRQPRADGAPIFRPAVTAWKLLDGH